jgi:hypothetical protein
MALTLKQRLASDFENKGIHKIQGTGNLVVSVQKTGKLKTRLFPSSRGENKNKYTANNGLTKACS